MNDHGPLRWVFVPKKIVAPKILWNGDRPSASKELKIGSIVRQRCRA
jgi:hypothetical protein